MIYDKDVRISDAALMKLSIAQLTRYQQEWENDVYLQKHQEVVNCLADMVMIKLAAFKGKVTDTASEHEANRLHEQAIVEWKQKFRFDFPILMREEYRTNLTFSVISGSGKTMSIAPSRELFSFGRGFPRCPIFTADSPQARREKLLRSR